MKNTVWEKIIYLPIRTQWMAMLSIVFITGIFLTAHFLIPIHRERDEQDLELQTSLINIEQRLSEYQQKGAYSLLVQRRVPIEQAESLSALVLSYGIFISSWQDRHEQQNVKLLLSWPEFQIFWQQLADLKYRWLPLYLQLSAQDDAILINVIYEKAKNSTQGTRHSDD
ncbi:hypothetical protein [Rosenbergiella australiborealis]|uniref:hypothetical protein n=1 Tax=Rosenbergiella australiborealis TaxID=1544696 RepID=UPI001F4E9DE8|nr:hypothetical protein [Rosenbergiella australiborealis]